LHITICKYLLLQSGQLVRPVADVTLAVKQNGRW